MSTSAYETVDEAAIEALNFAYNMTNADPEHREHAGYIVTDPTAKDEDGKPTPYKFTEPVPGTQTESDLVFERDQEKIPLKIRAWYHSHPALSSSRYDTEEFSGSRESWGGRSGDVKFSDNHRLTGYLITPTKRIKRYNYLRAGGRSFWKLDSVSKDGKSNWSIYKPE